jgi:hypothetical protein
MEPPEPLGYCGPDRSPTGQDNEDWLGSREPEMPAQTLSPLSGDIEMVIDELVERWDSLLSERRLLYGAAGDDVDVLGTKTASILLAMKEALVDARAALHQHYVDWDGEPEDAVPLQLARAKIDATLNQGVPGDVR